jgi:hypothetical protein
MKNFFFFFFVVFFKKFLTSEALLVCVRTTTFRRGHTRRANVSPPIHSECLTAGNKEFKKNQHCTSVLIFSYSFGRGAQPGAENKGRRMLSIVGRKGMIKYGLAFR